MKRWTAGVPGGGYDILIGNGLLGDLGSLLKPLCNEMGVTVVTDRNVWEHHGEGFAASLAVAGMEPQIAMIPPGEQSKSVDRLVSLYDAFAEHGLKRGGLVVAFGGGVVGDLGGFAAATYLRGVRVVQVPTTLLAQADSGIGGKTGINLRQGKNLVGAFHQPSLVAIDPLLLRTLPPREWRNGMAEVIKYGAISSPGLAEVLEKGPVGDLSDIISECCRIKAGMVERDAQERGERLLLNFGHTLGHAIERRYRYERYCHGEAVAIGMAIAARMGEEMELTDPGTAERLERLLILHGLECAPPCPISELLPLLKMDKKGEGDGVRMIFLRRMGEAFVRPVAYREIGDLAERVERKWKSEG